MTIALITVLALLVAIAAAAALRYVINDGGGPQRQPTRPPWSLAPPNAHDH